MYGWCTTDNYKVLFALHHLVTNATLTYTNLSFRTLANSPHFLSQMIQYTRDRKIIIAFESL